MRLKLVLSFAVIVLTLFTQNSFAADFIDGGLVLEPDRIISTGGTKILSKETAQVFEVTGTMKHTIQLPDAARVPKGWVVYVYNKSGSLDGVDVRDDFGSLIANLKFNDAMMFHSLDSATPAGKWGLLGGGSGGGGAQLTDFSAVGPLAYNNAGEFSIPQSSPAMDGYLSQTDFSTFTNKLTSPLNAKGDLLSFNGTSHVKIPVGADGQLLTADATQASGVKWAAAPVSLPTQAGHAGQYLTTDGTTASWVALPSGESTTVSDTASIDLTLTGVNITADIQDGGVTTAKYANASINSGKLADNAVTTAKIADAAVTTAKILDANVTLDKLATGSVSADKLTVGAVDLATSKVTGVNPIVKGGTGTGTVAGAGQVLESNGTAYSASDFADAKTLRNIAFYANTTGGQLLIGVSNLTGSNHSVTSPGTATFRDSSATPLLYTRKLTSALTYTFPAGTTLGRASGTNEFYGYLVDNGGVLSLAASSKLLDETYPQALVQASSTATDSGVLYGSAASGTYPIRFLGKFRSAVTTTAANWDNASYGQSSGPTSNVAAQINIGTTFYGSITFPQVAACNFAGAGTTSWADLSTNTSCSANPSTTGLVSYPGIQKFGFRIPVAKAGVTYKVTINGAIGKYGASGQAKIRFSDGVDNSSEAGMYFNNTNEQALGSYSFILKPTTTGTKTYFLQASSVSGVFATVFLDSAQNPSASIVVEEIPSTSTLSASLITKDPLSYLSSQSPARVTGAAPTMLGQYRSYLRAGGSATSFSETNGAPTAAPSVADGFQIKTSGLLSTSDASGAPSRYDFFIPKGKFYKVIYYAFAGRSGKINVSPHSYTTVYDVGVMEGYDESTQILRIQQNTAGGNTNPRLGQDIEAGGYLQTAYFDIFLYDNPLAAGLALSKNSVRVANPNGLGGSSSGDNKISNFSTVIENRGSEAIYVPRTTTTADYFKAGASSTAEYCATWSDSFTTGTTMALTLDTDVTQNSTAIYTIPATKVLALQSTPGANSYGSVSWCGLLEPGQIIRAHGDGSTRATGNTTNGVFTFYKKATPLETVGAASTGGNVTSLNPSRQEFVTFGGTGATYTSPSACSSSPCGIVFGSGGIVSITRNATGNYTANAAVGTFSGPFFCNGNIQALNGIIVPNATPTATAFSFNAINIGNQANTDSQVNLQCSGPR